MIVLVQLVKKKTQNNNNVGHPKIFRRNHYRHSSIHPSVWLPQVRTLLPFFVRVLCECVSVFRGLQKRKNCWGSRERERKREKEESKIASFLSVGWAESAAPMTTPKDGHFHARRQRITQTATTPSSCSATVFFSLSPYFIASFPQEIRQKKTQLRAAKSPGWVHSSFYPPFKK